jgi:hypothetical protein
MDLQAFLNRTVCGFFVACLFLAAVYEFWVLSWVKNNPSNTVVPKDQELINLFHLYRHAFDTLQQMATEDSRYGWYVGYSDEDRLSKARQSDYNNMEAQIATNLDLLMDQTSLRFIFAHQGIVIGPRWAKGIEYIPGNYKREGVVLPSVDKAQTLPANIYLRPIETNWFIFYQRDE